MIAASSHVLFFYLSKVYPDGYIAVGYLLFLQEQIKDHHHQGRLVRCSRPRASGEKESEEEVDMDMGQGFIATTQA
jgi:hypothetical protein